MRLGKGKFMSPLSCSHVAGQVWRLDHPLTYVDSYGISYTVEAGFQSDMASVPRVLWQLFPPTGDYDEASVVHDWMYATGRQPRYTCDWVMLDAMLSQGCNPVTAWTFFAGLRLFGGFAWRCHRKRDARI